MTEDRIMTAKQTKLGLVMPVLILASMTWMAVEMLRGSASHIISNSGRPEAQILFTPSRSAISFYVFLVMLTLAPPINIAFLLYSIKSAARNGAPTPGRLASLAYGTIAVLTLALSSGIAGFAYESIQSRILVNGSGVAYRSGGEEMLMPWHELGSMVLESRRRGQELDLVGSGKTLRIDLVPFSVPDRELLMDTLVSVTKLTQMPPRDPDRQVWKRLPSIRDPMERRVPTIEDYRDSPMEER